MMLRHYGFDGRIPGQPDLNLRVNANYFGSRYYSTIANSASLEGMRRVIRKYKETRLALEQVRACSRTRLIDYVTKQFGNEMRFGNQTVWGRSGD